MLARGRLSRAQVCSCRSAFFVFFLWAAGATSASGKHLRQQQEIQSSRLQPSGLLTVRSLRVTGKAASGSNLFMGQSGSGFKIGTDASDNFLIEQDSAQGQPLIALDQENVLRLAASRVEALALDAANGISVRGVRQWQLTFAEDFASQGVGWSRTDVTKCGGVNMLGGFCKLSQGEVSKNFSQLPPHGQLRVVATYHFIDRWIGETGYFKLNIGQEHSPVVVWSEQHSQEMSKNGMNLCGQSATPEGKFSALIDVVVQHTEDSVRLDFGSTMTETDPCDESWGISGLEIYVRS